MKVAILAGGMGTRLAEETDVRPKPMVEIGGYPILWHIMMHYSHYGFNDFIIALGYKGDIIKKFMVDHCTLGGNLKVSARTGQIVNSDHKSPPWTVQLVETGVATQTGGRIKQLQPHIGNETFMLTWGDGVSNINLDELLAFHKSHGKLATVTIVRPPARFGFVELGPRHQVVGFSEKPQIGEGWINGAFFVLEPGIFDYIEGDYTAWEREPMEQLAADGQLMAYPHYSFWQCMDTVRDKKLLQRLWDAGRAEWKTWE